MVKTLRAQGHKVVYRVRSDGGVRITSIDGVKYKSSESTGNKTARKMLGLELSEARAKQLKKISIKKGTKRTPISEEMKALKEEINKNLAQREKQLRKQGAKKVKLGRVWIPNIREHIKALGEEDALASLKRGYRYSKGYAYVESLWALYKRVEALIPLVDEGQRHYIEEIASTMLSIINAEAEDFTNEDFQDIANNVYECEKGVISPAELNRRVMPVLNKYR